MRIEFTLLLHTFTNDEEGATAIEYGLIAALVSIVLVSGLMVLRGAMDSMYTSITDKVEATMN